MINNYMSAGVGTVNATILPVTSKRKITSPSLGTVTEPVSTIDPSQLQRDKSSYTVPLLDPKKVGDIGMLEGIIARLYEQFAPQEIAYTPRTDEEIAYAVSSWLRPGYDQAISDRQDMTRKNNANLDADAIARGMGSSTYVSDVKSRQQNAEADDIGRLESDYGANFSKYMQENITADQDRALEVQTTNAQLRADALQRAQDAALILYEKYKKNPKNFNLNVFISPAQVEYDNTISLMDDAARMEPFTGSTQQGKESRAQMIALIGSKGMDQLAQKYAKV